jgi:hypothetical protein
MTQRTTVRLPEGLLDRAKRKAAAEGRRLASLIEDGLRLMVAGGKKAAKSKSCLPSAKLLAARCSVAERSQNREFFQGPEELFRISASDADGLVDEHRLTRRVRR